MKPTILKRVWKEVKEVNADFFNLRTVISPDLIDDNMTRFYFMMIPNDGAIAHLTIVGRFYVPDDYPESPPIVQLHTHTERPNVDKYRHKLKSKRPRRSTVCFDIFRSQAEWGSWKPEYTLSSLFASLMSAIVSFYVAQQYGADRHEYVSMALLRSVKAEAKDVYERHKCHLPEVPRLPLVEAESVPAKSLFASRELIVGCPETVTSEPIYLQTGSDEVYSFAIDLSVLHDNVIFSVILSSQKEPTDLLGQNTETILVRNGVTATAARKIAHGRMIWFYHGKPMNDGDMRLHVTIGRDQMTFAYHEDGRVYVHGDCPLSRLSMEHIGDVKDVPFYVHIYTKDKNKKPEQKQKKPKAEIPNNKAAKKEARRKRYQAKHGIEEVDEQKGAESSKTTETAESVEETPIPDEEERVILKILDIDGKGYIHESVGEDERSDFGFELVKRPDERNDFGFELIKPSSAPN